MATNDFTLFWTISLLCAIAKGFNVDTATPLIHVGPSDSMFGFAVSLHRNGDENWLLVGAPKASTNQQDVEQGGAVYKCPASRDSTDFCEQIPFDTSGPRLELNGDISEPIDDKSHQWFGATLASSGQDGIIVACAPRYVYFTTDFDNRKPVGTCYKAEQDFSRFREYSPCKLYDGEWNQVGYCQAGMSAAVTKDKRHLVIGAVGSYYWQGQVYTENLLYTDQKYTEEGPVTDDCTYMGYSVAVGDFTPDRLDDYAVGVPKSNDLKGMVKLLDYHLQTWTELLGEQLGSYFGHSVTGTDVNGDNRDDVIVGAPYFTDKSTDTVEKWEAGRVYVFYQDANFGYGEPVKLTGTVTRGRFGTAVAAIKDINQDSYNDIAVGAPYGGIDGKGAVYIYHGSINGIITEPAQVIMASTISSDLYTFGYSIAGGLDMDNNFYPDVLVGAYDSSQAVLLRSRPVVNINAEINIHPPDVIDLEKKTCVKYDGTPVACFTLTVCFKFSGVHVPSSIAVEFTTSLDTYLKSHQKRAYFQKTDTTVESGAFTVHESSDWCRAGFILLRDDITDKYSPIAIDVNYRLVENQNVPSEELSPVLNNYIEPKVEKLVYIQNDCGDNRICVPDLLLMSQIDSVYIGSTETTTLSVVVTNAGDDAFEAYVAIQLPEGFDYVRVEKGQTDYTIACIDTPGVSGLVKCDVGNPLKKNAVVEFALTLSTLKLDDTLKTTEIQLYANCTNPEDPSTLYDNEKTEYISVKVKSVISFTGVSAPEQITFTPREPNTNILISHEDDVGPEVKHIYEVRNLGPSSIDGADIQIFWPAYTPYGDHLLYLLDVSLQGDMPCIIDGKLNPENLQTNADFTISNYTESSKVKRGSRYRRDEKTVYRVDCQFAQCVKITCSIDFVLHGGDTALVEIKSRLWKDTVAKVPAKFDETEIKSDGHVLITSMPYSIPPESYPGADDEISSIAIPMSAKAGTLPVPIWVIIVSIIGGLLILALIIVVLWKAGFFKRKRVGVKYMEVSQNTTNENITMSDPPPGKNL